jgi:hypothetical protein
MMTKQVKGFLAPDGKFFEDRWECDRYTYQQQIESLCDTHNINADNFLSLLNSWHEPIKGYYHADGQCKSKQANGSDPVFEQPEFPPVEDDQANSPIGDKDAPGFLEQSIGGYK